MKYLFFDVDGTLFGKSRYVTERTIEEMQKIKKKGHKIFICTGRAPVSIVGGNLERVPADGFIASAGGFVSVNGKYIFKNYMDTTVLQEVMTLFMNHKVRFALETENAIYQTPGINEYFDARHQKEFGDNPEMKRYFEVRRQKENRLPMSAFNVSETGVTKIAFVATDRYLFLDIVKYLVDHFNVVTFSKKGSEIIDGEIILKDCTKADGIKRVLDEIGGSVEDTIAFGDSMNDYQMIDLCHIGIVSKKASDKLKKLAQYQFDDPDQDGIAKALEQLNL